MSALRLFVLVARFEGLSFLILLLVAMPLKYLAGEPGAVRVFGAAHGLLFLAYLALLARVATEGDWTWRRVIAAVVASILPLGVFWFERELRRDGLLVA